MTCRQVLSLLEDYVDNELSPAQHDIVDSHLKQCPQCRAEHEATRRLKELMTNVKTAYPDADYWEETTDLILARTIGADEAYYSPAATDNSPRQGRDAFIRSIISVAASLFILFTAIYLGQQQEGRIDRMASVPAPVLVAAPLQNLFFDDTMEFATRDEQSRLLNGMLLVGPPGVLGKFARMPDPASW
ncbi:MAG: zf-HC2 domain-containing protein [candidate division Zixibacteria bacterium]|nr:zf-HC2 domain-containing protein [candidate division Zixibacteria bacterium]